MLIAPEMRQNLVQSSSDLSASWMRYDNCHMYVITMEKHNCMRICSFDNMFTKLWIIIVRWCCYWIIFVLYQFFQNYWENDENYDFQSMWKTMSSCWHDMNCIIQSFVHWNRICTVYFTNNTTKNDINMLKPLYDIMIFNYAFDYMSHIIF